MKTVQFVLLGIAATLITLIGVTVGTVGVSAIIPSVLNFCEYTILGCLLLLLIARRLHYYPRALVSEVAGFAGPCVPVRLQRNQILLRIEGGPSGYFRRVLRVPRLPLAVSVGEEFHGFIYRGRVLTTEGIYGSLPC